MARTPVRKSLAFDGRHTPLLAALALVAVAVGGLLVGIEPVGGDADLMYRPIKAELAGALRAGGLPFWSDRFGVGTPLVAESHAAAFYPPNWVAYRWLDVKTAYRLMMWFHYTGLVAATSFYGRTLGLTPWGGAVAGLAFTLCGFQAAHAGHEPFYHALPFLPLTLGFAERYLAGGRPAWLAALALGLGAQFTLGHFQIQATTAGLVALTGFWRAAVRREVWARTAGLLASIFWGVGVAAVQLTQTYELTKYVSFERPARFLSNYAFPPSHLAQLAHPIFFRATRGPSWEAYWGEYATSATEAWFYVGTVPLILAGAGFVAKGDRSLTPWRWLAPLAVLLSALPLVWPDAFLVWLRLPVVGSFRAPGRYTAVASLGLCLMAGRGFDTALPSRRFWIGVALAGAFGAAATAGLVVRSMRPDVIAASDGAARIPLIAAGVAAWLVALAAVAAWRAGRLSAFGPVALAACELSFLYYQGPTRWGWGVRYPDDSPVFRRLVREPGVRRVTGPVSNLPVLSGMTTADPYLGIAPPPPNYLLEPVAHPERSTFDTAVWRRRLGVTHRVRSDADLPFPPPADVIFDGPDPALGAGVRWRIERYADAFPEARPALKVRIASGWYELFPQLTAAADPAEVWFLTCDVPPDPPGPRARAARVLSWDGRSGAVEHDGTCDLVLLRTFYPGWTARLDGGPEVAVARADGGVQAVRLPGSGVTRVSVRYRPTLLGFGGFVSVVATVAALAVVAAEGVRSFGSRRDQATG